MTVIGYMSSKQYDSVLFLVAMGIIFKRFNKNLSLVLIIAVFVTSLYSYVKESTLENMAGFRSRYKSKHNKNVSLTTDEDKVEQYNNIKDTYNDLISTIKAKTAQIKEMTKKIKV
jgi:hypothetical protein